MKRFVAVALLAAVAARAETFDLHGFVTARAADATGPRSWLEGGFGRLGVSGGGRGEGHGNALAVAELGLDWTPSPYFTAHGHGVARAEPSQFHGKRGGLITAYVEAHADRGNHSVQLRAGQFFLPTSRENKGDLWSSPYTISFSPLNTWIGEELRPIGLDAEWRYTTAGGAVVTTGATAFRGNDTMGALLAWRGWSVGNRLSVYNEVLPLPPLPLLVERFARQRDDGTKPFGTDLDGRIGYAMRFRYSLPERAMIQVTRVDNRGDRQLYRGEYAWATPFNIVSAEAGSTESTVVAAEVSNGSTGMGPRPFGADLTFAAGYLLMSHRVERHRLSARYDWFQTRARFRADAGDYDEHGRGWTLAYFFNVTAKVRAGIEFTQITGDRSAAIDAGVDPNMDGQSVILELRYAF